MGKNLKKKRKNGLQKKKKVKTKRPKSRGNKKKGKGNNINIRGKKSKNQSIKQGNNKNEGKKKNGGKKKKLKEMKKKNGGKKKKLKERKKKNGGKKKKLKEGKKKNGGKKKKLKDRKKKQKDRKKKQKEKKKKLKEKKKRNKKLKGKKNKLKKNKSKKNKGKKRKTKQNTCPTREVNYECMQAALDAMLFEQAQITNYLKQAKLLERHQDLSGNKAGKKDQFKEAEDHLLWAVGGNMSSPKCGPNDTSSSKYNSSLYEYEMNLAKESYAILINCSNAIHAACNISNLETYDQDGHAENMTICRNLKNEAIANNNRCQNLTEDVSAQCDCWLNQTVLIAKIKEFKCNTKDKQKEVTKFKKKCIETFQACKKMEDKSVESVYYCMEDHSMSFINQTSESLANAASKDSRLEAEKILNDEDRLKEFLIELDLKKI